MGWEMLARYAGWAALVLGIAGAIWYGASTIHDNIYNDGVKAERGVWEEREVELSAKRNEKILELEKKLADAEAAYKKRAGESASKFIMEEQNASKRKDDDTRNALSGRTRLRYKSEAAERGNSVGAKSNSSPTESSCNDKESAELPREVASNLFGLANDADRDVRQLGAAQDEILSLHTFISQACNGEFNEKSTFYPEAKN